MIRCCLCRRSEVSIVELEETDLPGTGYRCPDHVGCRGRVRAIVESHVELARVCEETDKTIWKP